MARPLICTSLTASNDITTAAQKKVILNGSTATVYAYNRTGETYSIVSGTQKLELDGTGLGMPGANPTSASSANCVLVNGDYLRISTSSVRFKKDVATLDAAHAKAAVLAMRPITYRPKNADEDQRRYVGLLAEEVQQVAPLLCTYDEGGESGTPNYVTYDRVCAYLVSLAQDHERRVAALEAK